VPRRRHFPKTIGNLFPGGVKVLCKVKVHRLGGGQGRKENRSTIGDRGKENWGTAITTGPHDGGRSYVRGATQRVKKN